MDIKSSEYVLKTYNLLLQFGLDFRKFYRAVRGIIPFLADYVRFKRNYDGKLTLYPCLHDRFDSSGSSNNEYFWQDLIVAKRINRLSPERHLDVGSRIDGFIAHLASFREVDVIDIRPSNISLPSIRFKQLDMMDSAQVQRFIESEGMYESISCLHSIEHFGLGRYGDTLKVDGWRDGLKNLCALTELDGVLYLSCPIGRERVEFNAHRVFDPFTILKAAEEYGCVLVDFLLIRSKGGLEMQELPILDLLHYASVNNYHLGIFILRKNS